MKAVHLQTDHLFAPKGLGHSDPCFSWFCQGDRKQSAYRIIVRKDEEVMWDTGKVSSSLNHDIPYRGKALSSRDILHWSVSLWNEEDEEGESITSTFEMGLLNKEDFKAKWISGNYKPKKNRRYPVDCFRKSFELNQTKNGRLYASAKGVYDVFINGKRVEDFILAPGITDYRKRIQYQTYDVQELLKIGENVLELRLADGWYRGSSAAYGVTNVYGLQTALIGQLEVDKKIVCLTDESFEWSNDGELLFADLKDGEIADLNKRPSYSSHAITAKQEGELFSSDNVYVKEKEVFKAKLIKRDVNKYVFDFSQNIAGYIRFKGDGKKGDRLVITCGEVLDENKDLDMKGIQLPRPAKGWDQISLIKNLLGKEPKGDVIMTPLQQVDLTLKEGYNEYKTSFAVFGFRYIEVISDFPLNEDMFEAIAVYSDMEETGDFECSNKLLDRFVKNVRWSMKSNFLDIPTDCPTRERLGWTGDAQIFFNSASYLMDVSSFFRKWLRDMEDAQYKNGVLPAVLPYEGVEMMYKATGTSVGWADAVYLIPYRYYLRYSDRKILEDSWDMIRKYADYLMKNLGFRDRKKAKADPLNNEFVYEKGVHLGEWLEPEEFRDKVYGTKALHPEECTAYLHYSMTVIGKIAELLGEKDYARKCEMIAIGSKEVYNRLFVENGTIDTGRQAKLVRPLALGLLEGQTKTNVQKRLKKAIEDYDHCVGTGFLSTPFILPVLEEAGYTDTAFKVLENEKAPGWLSEVRQGATSIWENWEGDLSQNHYSPGAAIEWLFTSVLGINVRNDEVQLRPVFDPSLNYAKGHYQSIYGDIKAAWTTKEDHFLYEVEVPANTVAKLILPDGEEKQLEAGSYEFRINR